LKKNIPTLSKLISLSSVKNWLGDRKANIKAAKSAVKISLNPDELEEYFMEQLQFDDFYVSASPDIQKAFRQIVYEETHKKRKYKMGNVAAASITINKRFNSELGRKLDSKTEALKDLVTFKNKFKDEEVNE